VLASYPGLGRVRVPQVPGGRGDKSRARSKGERAAMDFYPDALRERLAIEGARLSDRPNA
jgi:hypothetical protein